MLIDIPNPCLLHICGSWSNPLYCILHKPWFDVCFNYRKRFFLGLPSPSYDSNGQYSLKLE